MNLILALWPALCAGGDRSLRLPDEESQVLNTHVPARCRGRGVVVVQGSPPRGWGFWGCATASLENIPKSAHNRHRGTANHQNGAAPCA